MAKISEKAVYEYSAPFPGGVPGLPQRLTGAEAKERGVEDLLKEALEIGTFREVKSKKEVED